MRIYLKIKANGGTIPFDHQKKLTGTIHKWIGSDNTEHGQPSLYSFSMLGGGKKSNAGDGLIFPHGTSFFISAFENEFIKQITMSIQKDPDLFLGLKVYEIIIREDPDFENTEHFQVASPVLIKRREGEQIKHYLYSNAESSEYLHETLRHKMEIAGLNDDGLKIMFDGTYHAAKSKLVQYNGIKNKCSICPVIIKGKPETKLFAWNVGIGNSTGIGFGALK